jgi:MFS family permease
MGERTSLQSASVSRRGPAFRFFFDHAIDEYPSSGKRTAYLAIAVWATIVLYYTYYTQTGVTPNILASYHMSFAFYVGIVIVSNLIGAFASLPASQTDRLGRTNVVIYGLLIIGLLVTFGVTNASTQWEFAVVISAIGLVEGAILVATPALVRDFSPQLGRASAMGFWTVGPVAGSLITSIIANHTLSSLHPWQDQFWISGLTALGSFVLCLFLLKDLSPRLRDQLMVSLRDQALVEARARGLSDSEVKAATARPWRQILKWDLVGSSFGIAVFLLIYYVAAGFFTIYFAVTFKNPDGTYFSTQQANGLNTWFWSADIVALIVVGLLSDWLKVRKPFMLLGTLISMALLAIFIFEANDPHTGYYTLVTTAVILAVGLSLAYAPWMAGYTETVESKNPALVATGLALWGWILRLVVGLSFIALPFVINSVTSVVDNQPVASHVIDGQPISSWVATHGNVVAFAQQHAALLTAVAALPPSVQAGLNATPPKAAAVSYATKALGPVKFAQLVKLAPQFKTLVVPNAAQLKYIQAHQAQLTSLQSAVNKSPSQWQTWFWIDFAGMVVFIPLIFLTRGRWSPGAARRDEQEHERAVLEELARLEQEKSGAGAAPAGTL